MNTRSSGLVGDKSVWLFIDTARAGEFRLGLLSGGRPRLVAGMGRSNKFLTALARLAPADELARVAGICVVAGPGSFTAVRTGVLIANILARQLNKPLVGVDVGQAADLKRLADAFVGGEFKPAGYVAPVYDSEPNITLKQTTGAQCYV